jgi:hypothetical protein
MPVVTITQETNHIYNEIRYFVRVDGKFIKGFDNLEQAEYVAEQLAKHGGKETTGEITIKEIIA